MSPEILCHYWGCCVKEVLFNDRGMSLTVKLTTLGAIMVLLKDTELSLTLKLSIFQLAAIPVLSNYSEKTVNFNDNSTHPCTNGIQGLQEVYNSAGGRRQIHERKNHEKDSV